MVQEAVAGLLETIGLSPLPGRGESAEAGSGERQTAGLGTGAKATEGAVK